MKAIGLPLFAAEGCGSPAITAVAPEGIDAEQLRKAVKGKFDILLAGVQAVSYTHLTLPTICSV